MAKTTNKSRNFTLPGGVSRYSRSALFKLKAAHKHKYATVAAKAAKAATKTVKYGANGSRTVPVKKSVCPLYCISSECFNFIDVLRVHREIYCGPTNQSLFIPSCAEIVAPCSPSRTS